ncbi:MAG: hypothetical protein HY560_13550 [Gemmatimonadetes bacterium]|nr:hypothetical protein [Gemmatimonadota bacterium]
MRRGYAALALLMVACGGEKGTPAAGGMAGQGAAPATAAPAGTGTVHEVKMQLVNGKYSFAPASLTIKVGDTVKWINWSGPPHNVAFKKDRIPAGAAEVLNRVMPERMGDLAGKFLIDSLATYQISFGNAPPGTYAYTCQPHETLGMNATLTVQP